MIPKLNQIKIFHPFDIRPIWEFLQNHAASIGGTSIELGLKFLPLNEGKRPDRLYCIEDDVIYPFTVLLGPFDTILLSIFHIHKG